MIDARQNIAKFLFQQRTIFLNVSIAIVGRDVSETVLTLQLGTHTGGDGDHLMETDPLSFLFVFYIIPLISSPQAYISNQLF